MEIYPVFMVATVVVIVASTYANERDTTTPISSADGWTKIMKSVSNEASSGKEAKGNLKPKCKPAGDLRLLNDNSTSHEKEDEISRKSNATYDIARSSGEESIGKLKTLISGLISVAPTYVSEGDTTTPISTADGWTTLLNIVRNEASSGERAIGNLKSEYKPAGVLRLRNDVSTSQEEEEVISRMSNDTIARSSVEESIGMLKTPTSGLTSDLEAHSIPTSLIGNSIDIIKTTSQTLQNVVTKVSGAVTGTLKAVKDGANSFIGIGSKWSDKAIETIAFITGTELKKGIAGCVDKAINEGITTFQNLIGATIDCPIVKVESVSSKVADLVGTPAAAINLIESTAQELTVCKENSSIVYRVICWLKTVIVAKINAAAMVITTVNTVISAIMEISTMGQAIMICATTNLAPASLSVGKIFAHVGTCSIFG